MATSMDGFFFFFLWLLAKFPNCEEKKDTFWAISSEREQLFSLTKLRRLEIISLSSASCPKIFACLVSKAATSGCAVCGRNSGFQYTSFPHQINYNSLKLINHCPLRWVIRPSFLHITSDNEQVCDFFSFFMFKCDENVFNMIDILQFLIFCQLHKFFISLWISFKLSELKHDPKCKRKCEMHSIFRN